MQRRWLVWLGSVALAGLMSAGCSGAGAGSISHSAAKGGSMSGSFSETPSPFGPVASGAASSGSEGGGSSVAAPAADSGAVGSSGTGGQSNVSVGLRAGGVDDNARFADYLTYLEQFASLGIKARFFDVTNRHVFTVTNRDGKPVLGADILITGPGQKTGTELRTYADGRALWFPPPGTAGRFTATVSIGNATTTLQIDPANRTYPVTLDAPPTVAPVKLDVEFVVDATGSMGDEIAQLKASLADIAARIQALPAKPDVRFALTIYRDRVDPFLTRTWNFSSDLTAFQHQIAGVSADGGGDYPEDVQQGLYDGLNKPTWRGPGTIKLMFLVGDAPPHLDYTNDPDYVTTAGQAATAGVKVETLAASGLDDQGEYVWRQLAEMTFGEFLFLTYGPNGGPGDATTHHVSGYTPTNLDDLIVGLVTREVNATSGTDTPSQSNGYQTPGQQP